MKQVNQQEIAKALRLSKATVSRCFTNHPGINPETRARVFEMASQMGYRHRMTRVANGRIPRVRPAIGVLVCTEEEEYYRTDYESPGRLLLKGISECSQLEGIDISVHFIDPSAGSLDAPVYANLFRSAGRSWSGLLLLYPFPKEVVDGLLLKYPCVSLVEQRGASTLDCVDVNHYQGIALTVNRLHDFGHRRIAFYSKPYKVEASWSLRRTGAYFEKMTQLGLKIRDCDMINTHPQNPLSLEASFDLAADRVRKGVTAIVCAADHQAYDLIRALRERGIQVPQDVSVTGFDGIEPPAGMPSLSTVEIPYRDIGFSATKRLKDLLKKRFGPPQHILLGCNLREGDTVAAVS